MEIYEKNERIKYEEWFNIEKEDNGELMITKYKNS